MNVQMRKKIAPSFFLRLSETEKITTTTHQNSVYTTKMGVYHVYKN